MTALWILGGAVVVGALVWLAAAMRRAGRDAAEKEGAENARDASNAMRDAAGRVRHDDPAERMRRGEF